MAESLSSQQSLTGSSVTITQKYNHRISAIGLDETTTPTWLGGISLPPLGPDAVLPTHVGVPDEAADVAEQLAEAHVSGVVDGIVE